jgi:selenocysteine-specific elongation factor
VVAADESVMPQTREHFDICRLLGVGRGLVVVTKTDAAEPGMTELVSDEVRELVAGSFLEGAPIVPVSARTGDGLDVLRRTIAALAREVPTRNDRGAARLPVDRAFTMKGFGTVVTGTLVHGTIAVDDELALLPDERRVKVRGLHMHGGARPRVSAGKRVAVNLAGVDVADVPRGSVLATPGAFGVTRRADVHLSMLPGATLGHGGTAGAGVGGRRRWSRGRGRRGRRAAALRGAGGADAR